MLGETSQRSKSGEVLLKVRCTCGHEQLLIKSKYKSGQSKRCRTCANKAHGDVMRGTVRIEDAPLRRVLQTYKYHAQKRSLSFTISDEDFKALLLQDCHYCGAAPAQIKYKHKRSTSYNGVDRVNNSLGYVDGNCVSCCKICNRIKMDHDLSTIMQHLRIMLERYDGK